MTLPALRKNSHCFTFEIDGHPTVLLGGQVHNSSASSIESINEKFAKVASLNYNFVIAPVAWDQFEATEGAFDYTLIKHQIKTAEQHNLKLVILWFGAFKNARSSYTPSWVRSDRDRFPRALNQPNGEPDLGATISVFSDNLLAADKAAFSALMTFLAKNDKKHTVVMVQIENEMGLLGSSRDHCALAESAWQQAGMADNWQSHEQFMAGRFASYTNELAKSGKAIKNLPMYVNAWLGPQKGQSEAGQWPSGGPSDLVLNTWKQYAPDVDILSPDIYVHEALEVMKTYHRPDNALFIPESRHILGNMIWAIGNHKAIGYAMFGAEDARLGNQMSSAYKILREATGVIAKAQAEGKIRAVLMREPQTEGNISFDSLTITPKDNIAMVKRFVEMAGVDLLVQEFPEGSELEDLPIVIESPADSRPCALVIQINEFEYYVIGRGVNLSFSEPGYRIEIDDVEEGRFENEQWIPMRNLNGDERMNFVPVFELGCAKVRILKLSN